MAATKTYRTLQSSATNTAGSTTTGSGLDLTTAYGGLFTAKITNGGTGPTLPCSLFIDVSGNNSDWKLFRQYQAGVTSSAVYEFAMEIPQATMYVRSRFTGNTGQSVTVEAFLHELTAI